MKESRVSGWQAGSFACILLALTAAAKIWPLIFERSVWHSYDPSFDIKKAYLYLATAVAELGLVVLHLRGKQREFSLGLLWLSGVFVLFHVQRAIGMLSTKACSCLGILPNLFNLSNTISDWIAFALAVGLFVVGLYLLSLDAQNTLGQTDQPHVPNVVKRTWRRWMVVEVLASTIFLLWLWVEPALAPVLEYGGDEHFELMKAQVANSGAILYKDIWSDQPPAFTRFLQVCVALSPHEAKAARVAVGIWVTISLISLLLVVGERAPPFTGLLLIAILMASSTVQLLMYSAMQEWPMIGSALMGAACFLKGVRSRGAVWMFAAGMLAALSIHIKFTAVLILAPCLVGIWLNERKYLTMLRGAWVWLLIGAAAATLPLVSSYAAGDIVSLFGTHFRVANLQAEYIQATFNWQFVAQHREVYMLAGFGIVSLACTGRWREMTIPVLLLVVQVLFSATYRPWWPFYYLDLMIPVAWLASLGFMSSLQTIWEAFHARRSLLAGATAAMALLAFGFPCLWKTPIRINNFREANLIRPRVDEGPWVAKLARWKGVAKQVYSKRQILSFYAGLESPPWLIVLSSKRLWSGQISTEKIVSELRKKPPELLVLRDEKISPLFQEMIAEKYREGERTEGLIMFIRNDVDAPSGSNAAQIP